MNNGLNNSPAFDPSARYINGRLAQPIDGAPEDEEIEEITIVRRINRTTINSYHSFHGSTPEPIKGLKQPVTESNSRLVCSAHIHFIYAFGTLGRELSSFR